uniref:Uncharacterized protein n=1 Tax=Colobus angolensis palliatus TaxID=336983 RepID=A0A2K5JZR1_COLAP
MLARRGLTLQKMEMHRKLKVLEMPSEVCAFLITVVRNTIFKIKFYKNAEFCFTFFLSYVVSTQSTSLLFWGEGAYVTNRMSLKLD